jgi:hypothetical protein
MLDNNQLTEHRQKLLASYRRVKFLGRRGLWEIAVILIDPMSADN